MLSEAGPQYRPVQSKDLRSLLPLQFYRAIASPANSWFSFACRSSK